MNRLAILTAFTLASCAIWLMIGYAVMSGSRQQCELTASSDVCQWELR